MNTPTAEQLAEACRELRWLWGDLNTARYSAIRGKWSMECDSLVERIKLLTKLVGPTPWEVIQIGLLEDGIYQRVHEEIGVPAAVDMAGVAKTRRYIEEQL